ncbi:hypothetical protein ACTJKN_02610 [Pedobacter sp. 22163]|uniref:hypothetical protein n=1 Tax=Pedobacter sp. 22163 TaxID=3453883 RepID=UPI003F87FB5C
MKSKYIDQLSGLFTTGEAWSAKFKNASKLFDVPFQTSPVIRAIDSIWAYRNKVAHMNRRYHSPIKLIGLNAEELMIANMVNDDTYFTFCIALLEIMTNGLDLIKKFEEKILQKWSNTTESNPD